MGFSVKVRQNKGVNKYNETEMVSWIYIFKSENVQILLKSK